MTQAIEFMHLFFWHAICITPINPEGTIGQHKEIDDGTAYE